MIEFCDHAKDRLKERIPELAGMIAEIEASISKHVKEGYSENVDLWCKIPPRQCLRVTIGEVECYAVISTMAIITVYNRDFAVRLKYGQKHKRRLKSCQNWDSRHTKR